MATYYTMASFLIPCDDVQAKLALDALKMISGEVSPYAYHCQFSTGDKGSVSNLVRALMNEHPDNSQDEFDYFNIGDEIEYQFDAQISKGEGLWIHHDESINTEHAAYFTHVVLSEFNIDDIVIIECSYTCSRPVLDAYGGDVFSVTKDSIRWLGSHNFIHAETQAHKNKAKFELCNILTDDSAYQYNQQFVLEITDKADRHALLMDAIKSSTGSETSIAINENTFVVDGKRTVTVEASMIEPAVYAELKRHLPSFPVLLDDALVLF